MSYQHSGEYVATFSHLRQMKADYIDTIPRDRIQDATQSSIVKAEETNIVMQVEDNRVTVLPLQTILSSVNGAELIIDTSQQGLTKIQSGTNDLMIMYGIDGNLQMGVAQQILIDDTRVSLLTDRIDTLDDYRVHDEQGTEVYRVQNAPTAVLTTLAKQDTIVQTPGTVTVQDALGESVFFDGFLKCDKTPWALQSTIDVTQPFELPYKIPNLGDINDGVVNTMKDRGNGQRLTVENDLITYKNAGGTTLLSISPADFTVQNVGTMTLTSSDVQSPQTIQSIKLVPGSTALPYFEGVLTSGRGFSAPFGLIQWRTPDLSQVYSIQTNKANDPNSHFAMTGLLSCTDHVNTTYAALANEIAITKGYLEKMISETRRSYRTGTFQVRDLGGTTGPVLSTGCVLTATKTGINITTGEFAITYSNAGYVPVVMMTLRNITATQSIPDCRTQPAMVYAVTATSCKVLIRDDSLSSQTDDLYCQVLLVAPDKSSL